VNFYIPECVKPPDHDEMELRLVIWIYNKLRKKTLFWIGNGSLYWTQFCRLTALLQKAGITNDVLWCHIDIKITHNRKLKRKPLKFLHCASVQKLRHIKHFPVRGTNQLLYELLEKINSAKIIDIPVTR
jgi:hypothetical protein